MTFALHHYKRLRPWALWFTLCVALVGALVPTLSHTLAWSLGGAPGYGAICTTAAQVAASDSADQPAGTSGGQGSAMSLQHCPFCLHSSDRCAPPPAQAVFFFLPDQPAQGIVRVGVPIHGARYYLRAPPRGPPAFA